VGLYVGALSWSCRAPLHNVVTTDNEEGVINMISTAPKTQIEDLSELGPEIDEG
jgi:hypothetical protein